MQDNFSILVVCTGNVCRSPLAERLLANHLRDIPEITVSSAGTHALVDQPMFNVTRQLASSYGLEDADSHRARQMAETHLESSDLILTMTRDQRRAVVELSPRVVRRTFTLREFARLAEATSDESLAAEICSTGESHADRLTAAVNAVTTSRGSLLPGLDPADDDVIDPYKRELEVHEASVEQLVPAVDAVVSLFTRALEGAA